VTCLWRLFFQFMTEKWGSYLFSSILAFILDASYDLKPVKQTGAKSYKLSSNSCKLGSLTCLRCQCCHKLTSKRAWCKSTMQWLIKYHLYQLRASNQWQRRNIIYMLLDYTVYKYKYMGEGGIQAIQSSQSAKLFRGRKKHNFQQTKNIHKTVIECLHIL